MTKNSELKIADSADALQNSGCYHMELEEG